MQARLNYRGGARQVDRMIEDKNWSLSKALIYSYQSATAVLSDGREFRCLINPNKISMELDDKILSIPFKDICLNKVTNPNHRVKEEIGIKCGDVIRWKENGTHWIVYSQYLQEIAYFRGQMRQCEAEPLEINGEHFWYYLKGPDEKTIDWQKSKNFIFNDLNYTIEIYISNNSTTKQFFHRFAKIKLPFKNSDGEYEYRPYEVQAVDDLSTSGILTVYLKEDYKNQWETPIVEDKSTSQSAQVLALDHYTPAISLDGPTEIYPYDTITYHILGAVGGKWQISNSRACIKSQTDTSVTIEVITGKSGNFNLIYTGNDGVNTEFLISILSL